MNEVTDKSNSESLSEEEDFEAIEAAVMETARGRWFLAEFARRNRNADTDVLMNAIEKLQTTVEYSSTSDDIRHLYEDLSDIARAIAGRHREISATWHIKAEKEDLCSSIQSNGLRNAMTSAMELISEDIPNIAQRIKAITQRLRENNAHMGHCDMLDTQVEELKMISSFQDMAGQLTMNLLETFHFIEDRINAIIDLRQFDAHAIDADTREISSPDNANPDDIRTTTLTHAPNIDISEEKIDISEENIDVSEEKIDMSEEKIDISEENNDTYMLNISANMARIAPELERIISAVEPDYLSLLLGDLSRAQKTALFS